MRPLVEDIRKVIPVLERHRGLNLQRKKDPMRTEGYLPQGGSNRRAWGNSSDFQYFPGLLLMSPRRRSYCFTPLGT